jgi:hypothetical protein
MAALDGDRQPDKLVLDLDRTAAVEAYFGVLKRINDLSRILFASLVSVKARLRLLGSSSCRSQVSGKYSKCGRARLARPHPPVPRSAQCRRRAR